MFDKNDFEKVFDELEKNNKLYKNHYEYKNNIDIILNALFDKDLILGYEIRNDKIIINTYYNTNYYNLYIMFNYHSEFFMSVNIDKLIIYHDISNIKINDFYLGVESILLSSYYEFY